VKSCELPAFEMPGRSGALGGNLDVDGQSSIEMAASPRQL
jgi:hypothetical protein